MDNRNIMINGVVFTIANYRARDNGYERGLKYQVLKRVYDGSFCVGKDGKICNDYIFIPTGAKFSTIADAKKWIKDNAIYLS